MPNRRLFTAATLVCTCIPLVPAARAASDPVPAGPPAPSRSVPSAPAATLIDVSLPDVPDAALLQSSSSSSSPDDAKKNQHAGDPITPGTDPGKIAPGTALPQPTLEGHQTKRILGVMPNFRSVSANQKLPPQSVKEKFVTTLQDSFDYSSVIFSAGLAGIGQAQDSYPKFGQGAAGYGRYFWHTFADQTNENIWVEGIMPSVLHQDTRYYTLGHGGLLKRTRYAFTRVLVTRGDDQDAQPNYSEIVGAGIGSSVSSLYYPSAYRTWTKIGQRWLTNVMIDGGVLIFKEFWPDINNKTFHEKD
jgi:hypothetical protein